MIKNLNLSLLCDFYELTMSNGYFKSNLNNKVCYFDIFFRKVPDNGGFVIVAGLEQIINYIQNLYFDDEDIDFLKKQNIFDDEFLLFLKNFRFSGDLSALREGEIVFPYEPIISIRARACEAQLLETFLLLTLNHQSLIATKASRICRTAKKPVFEFGARRAQGSDAAINGARAAFIGGCVSTSCTLASKIYGINTSGTMAHSWVQIFDNELEAFKKYCQLYPQNTILLVDTYDSLKGIKNAIKAFKLSFKNKTNIGIRLDSGNLSEISRKARSMLDEAGFKHCKIIASGSLDEYNIKDLQDCPIDAYGVGEKLITSKSSPVLGCVYKLVAIEDNNQIIPKIKISENNEKITIPADKKLYRFYDENQKALNSFDDDIKKLKNSKKYKVKLSHKLNILKNKLLKESK